MAPDTVRKISFKPTSRRSSHVRTGQDRLAGTGRGTALCRASAQVTQVFGTHRSGRFGSRVRAGLAIGLRWAAALLVVRALVRLDRRGQAQRRS
jgi:hypothetical protein